MTTPRQYRMAQNSRSLCHGQTGRKVIADRQGGLNSDTSLTGLPKL